jgi:hypothetical protein
MPNICFSYSSDVPPGIPDRGAAQPAVPGHRRMSTGSCFSYPADLRRMPVFACFSYTTNVRRMPATNCFSYPADLPPGVRNRNAAP